MEHIVIIGNGISGITAARHIRKLSNHRITVISSESPYFFSRTALMYIYMGHMKFEHTKPYEDWFWKKNRIELLQDHVTKLETGTQTLHLESGKQLSWDKLILATGSKPNKFGWPGQDLQGVSGMYSLQDLHTIEQYTKNIRHGVIVGGGLIGVELAEMLHSRGIGVSFLIRESNFWNVVLPEDEASLVSNHLRKQGIDLRVSTELKEIVPDGSGRVRAVRTTTGEEIPCQFVGLTAGVSPNIGFVEGSGIKTDRGILVDAYLETNIKGIFAIGDCAQHIRPPGERKAVEQVWYTGRMQGETVAHSICSRPLKYQPGTWFNSAKFFDIEYQTYGWVWNKQKDNEDSFYWENKARTKCLRLVYDKTTTGLKGMHAFGIRLRHELIARWIADKVPVKQVMQKLYQANFDPEFHGRTEDQMLKKLMHEQMDWQE